MNGLLIIDKSPGMTSHDVVARVRRLAQERSVGHLGTLDPMAAGVLPLVLGKLTRLAQFYLDAEKMYEGVIRFGLSTDTYDAEGQPTSERMPVRFAGADLEVAISKFRGTIQQTPPPFSAKKIAGVPAYKLARKNQPVELKTVSVEVREFVIQSFTACDAGAEASFRATVSSGTYIRSIAHDVGQALGTGAHLKSLRRTKVGELDVNDSVTLEKLEAAPDSLPQHLLAARQLLPGLPSVSANEEQMAKIRHGNAVNLSEFSAAPLIKVFAHGELACIASRVAGTLFQPKIVLSEQS